MSRIQWRDKYQIVLYLALLFVGRSYWDVHKEISINQREISKPEFPQTLQRELAWVEATRRAIHAGKQTYLELLGTQDTGLRVAAAYLLGVIGETENEVLEQVAECCQKKP